MGHLTRIANHLVDNMEKGQNSERIKEIFQGKCSAQFVDVNLSIVLISAKIKQSRARF